MNYYGPREILDADGKPTGRFHYTCKNDGQVWPVGYCGAWRDCRQCGGRITNITGSAEGGLHCRACNGRGCVELPKNERCPGHATADEACEHHKEYLLDKATIRGPQEIKWPKHKCAVEGCESGGTFLMDAGGSLCFEVCEAHANRAALASLVRVGESVSSY